MRILVTGTSGHVGGAIAGHLVRRGHEVVGLSRRASGLAELASEHAIDLASTDAAAAMRDTIAPCAAVVHAAADISKALLSPTIPLVNCLGTEQVLEVVAAWHTSVFIFISGVSVVGRPQELPVADAPETSYHASKLYGEHLTRLAAHDKLRTVTLRLTAPVGPRMPRNRILPKFISNACAGAPLQLMGRGTRCQNYVDEQDFERAVELSLANEVRGTFNVGGAHSIANLDLAHMCISVLNSPSAIEFVDVADPEEGVDWSVDLNRSRDELGYVPQVSLETTIQSVATAMRAET